MRVETAAGPTEQTDKSRPLRFQLGRNTIEITEILDRWPGTNHTYVKLRGSDGATYILRHDQERDRWQIVLFQRGAGLSWPGR